MKIWGIGQISPSEKNEILSLHKEIYDGYKTMLPKVSNTQPLYVQDFANDKHGLVVNNRGEVKRYTNMGINESKGSMCSECGGMMEEGECMECGWKGEVGAMEESEQAMCECGGMMEEGECMECGYKMEETNEGYETGDLSDIYNVEDLGDSDFDYVEGGGNDYGTFEKAHHMRSIKNEQVDNTVDFQPDDSEEYENTDNEDDGFEDIEMGSSEMYEQGYTGGGNAPDMDVSNIESAYDFESEGPNFDDEPYDVEIDDMDLSGEDEMEPYNFKSNGPQEVFPEGEMIEDDHMVEYEPMESAWLYDDDGEMKEQGWATVARIAAPIAVNYVMNKMNNEEVGEMEEANDVSGVQGMYGDMKPAFDFDSEGPGSAGPYQTSDWGGGYEGEDEDVYWKKDLEPNELDLDLTKFNPEDKSWEEITDYTGEDEFSHLDEEIKESFLIQKKKINEMFHRMKVIK